MTLSQKQRGVFFGMAAAMLVSIIILVAAITINPFHYGRIEGADARMSLLGLSILLPTITLLVSIGRLAGFRFFSPQDIDGSGLTKGSQKAVILQSLLQNTLEQLTITVSTYAIWCFTMPANWLSAIPLCSLAFAIGRISFFRGYHKGASSRAFGFALTFYPTVLLMLTAAIYHACRFIGVSAG